MNKNCYVDLHIHTTASDGVMTPTEIVEYAKNNDVYFMSITDHDSISGITSAYKKAQELNIEFITGIELSCHDKKDTHVLGYNIDINNPKLLAAIDHLKKERLNRSIKMIKKLREDGFDINDQDVARFCNKDVIGRPHIAQMLIEKGYGNSTKEIFQKYIGSAAPYYIAYDKLSIKAGFDAIKSAGGLPVLAHPKLLRYNNLDTYKLLKRYKAMGLAGIEVYYPCHSNRDIKAYLQMAQELGLIVTFGSDFHNLTDKNKNKIGYDDSCYLIKETMDYLISHKNEKKSAIL